MMFVNKSPFFKISEQIIDKRIHICNTLYNVMRLQPDNSRNPNLI